MKWLITNAGQRIRYWQLVRKMFKGNNFNFKLSNFYSFFLLPEPAVKNGGRVGLIFF